MSCVVGLVAQGKVYLGGDSALATSSFVGSTAMPKVFRFGPAVVGFIGAPRVGQLVQHTMQPPTSIRTEPMAWVMDQFVPCFRAVLQKNNIQPENEEYSSALLIGLKGRLFELDVALSVLEYQSVFHAIGSGAEYAFGAHFVLNNSGIEASPKTVVETCLSASTAYCPSVSRPFHLVTTP